MALGTRATVLEAFDTTAGIPANTNEGNVIKLPPPATELITPAAKAATISSRYMVTNTLQVPLRFRSRYKLVRQQSVSPA
jgi:hypothetical protein